MPQQESWASKYFVWTTYNLCDPGPIIFYFLSFCLCKIISRSQVINPIFLRVFINKRIFSTWGIFLLSCPNLINSIKRKGLCSYYDDPILASMQATRQFS